MDEKEKRGKDRIEEIKNKKKYNNYNNNNNNNNETIHFAPIRIEGVYVRR